jgi:hypothetical protein
MSAVKPIGWVIRYPANENYKGTDEFVECHRGRYYRGSHGLIHAHVFDTAEEALEVLKTQPAPPVNLLAGVVVPVGEETPRRVLLSPDSVLAQKTLMDLLNKHRTGKPVDDK